MHLDKLADVLRGFGRDPVVLRGGMGARQRAAALAVSGHVVCIWFGGV